MGDAVGAPSGWPTLPLGDVVTAGLPVWIDAGYRLGPHLLLGAAFEYAHALVSVREGCQVPGFRCSANDVIAAAQAHYHPLPGRWLDPWLGLAIGYEALGVSTQVSGGSYSGVDVVFQVGCDWKPTPTVGVGPFLVLAAGPYVSCNSSTGAACSVGTPGVHEWLTVGVRAAYDFRLGP
jgi:hypothetical protein